MKKFNLPQIANNFFIFSIGFFTVAILTTVLSKVEASTTQTQYLSTTERNLLQNELNSNFYNQNISPYNYTNYTNPNSTSNQLDTTKKNSIYSSQYLQNKIDINKIQAEAVFVQNISTGEILIDKNADKPRPLASISKLMTAITVKKIQENWTYLPEKIKLVSNGTGYTEADLTVKSGGLMRINDLVSYMLLTSSNFAAYSLTHELIPFSSFMAYMNHTASEIGLENFHFVNGSGLTEENKQLSIEERNSIGSAKDVAKILKKIVDSYPELATVTRATDAVITSTSGKRVQISNTNKLLGNMDNIYLGKTGFTDDAGGNLAIVIKKDDQYFAIVVMGSTKEGRFEDVAYIASSI